MFKDRLLVLERPIYADLIRRRLEVNPVVSLLGPRQVGKTTLARSIAREFTVMRSVDRITFDANVMGGRPCIRGLRVTAGLVASGHSHADILKLYPYLEAEDITQALKYAAWRAEEIELPLQPA